MTDNQWLERETDTARQLLNQAHALLQQQGDVRNARANIDEALVILDMAEAEGHSDEQKELRSRALNERGLIHQHSGETGEAFSDHRDAADWLDRIDDIRPEFMGSAAAIHLNYGQLALLDDDYQTALRENKKALEYVEQLEEHDQQAALSLSLGAHQNLTALHSFQRNFERGEEHAEKSIDIAETIAEMGGAEALATAARVCQQLSVQLFEDTQFDRAVEWGRRAEELSERAYNELGPAALNSYIVSEINLISYYEQHRQYADAEDCLWKAIEVAGPDPEIVERGLVFYQNCRKQADARLEKGNLPRDEVNEGFEELREIAIEEGIID